MYLYLSIGDWFQKIKDQFYLNFIDDNRYMYIVKGLGVTLEVTFFAVLLGIALGIIVAIIRSTYDKIGKDAMDDWKNYSKKNKSLRNVWKGFLTWSLWIWNQIC
ncbi:MAG: hypothetical protein J5883_03015, partial [Clostridiales bacterium]|nr:hypothetical protein [Clostridiales bacterium]